MQKIKPEALVNDVRNLKKVKYDAEYQLQTRITALNALQSIRDLHKSNTQALSASLSGTIESLQVQYIYLLDEVKQLKEESEISVVSTTLNRTVQRRIEKLKTKLDTLLDESLARAAMDSFKETTEIVRGMR